MAVKSPSPAKTTKERIERDKREYARLVRKIKRVVYAGHPSVWDWVEDAYTAVSSSVGKAASAVVDFVSNEILVSQNLNRALEHTFTYPAEDFNRESKEQIEHLKDTVVDWFRDTSEDVTEKRDDIVETVKKAAAGLGGGAGAAASAGVDWLWKGFEALIAAIKALIDAMLTIFGDAMTNAFAAIMMLPDLLAKGLLVDLDTFVTEGLKLYKVNKLLVEAISKLEAKETVEE